jgi:hypothetical protein
VFVDSCSSLIVVLVGNQRWRARTMRALAVGKREGAKAKKNDDGLGCG